jgi:3',5'-cyclic AMP phosphodiesterase CpdA
MVFSYRYVRVTVLLTLFSVGPSASATESDPSDRRLGARRLLVVADNQFHIQTGHAYHLQQTLADAVVPVAVRPPHATVFGPLAYGALLRKTSNGDWVLHLGDAADVSCPDEFGAFLHAMKGLGHRWLFAPGNHDGYFTGNSEHRQWYRMTWEPACGGERLGKDAVVDRYVKARFPDAPALGMEVLESPLHSEAPGEPQVGFAARLNRDAPHRSFVVQQLRMELADKSYARLVLLDTVEYEDRPTYLGGGLLPGRMVAGITGAILADQRAIVEKWLQEASQLGDRILVAGHHPLKSQSWRGGLRLRSSYWLQTTLRKYGVRAYLSGHTHKGGYRTTGNDKNAIEELNVASLVDWPLGVRVLKLDPQRLWSEEILFDEDTVRTTFGESCSTLPEAWRAPAGGEFYSYTYYKELLSGPTGRILNHYLLLAELKALSDAIERLGGLQEVSNKSWLTEVQQVLKKGPTEFSFMRRIRESSAEAIDRLGPMVSDGSYRLFTLLTNLPEVEHRRADLYVWCQLWWASQADAGVSDGRVGSRDLTDGWTDRRQSEFAW